MSDYRLLLQPRCRNADRMGSAADASRLAVLAEAERTKAGRDRRRLCCWPRAAPAESKSKPRRAKGSENFSGEVMVKCRWTSTSTERCNAGRRSGSLGVGSLCTQASDRVVGMLAPKRWIVAEDARGVRVPIRLLVTRSYASDSKGFQTKPEIVRARLASPRQSCRITH